MKRIFLLGKMKKIPPENPPPPFLLIIHVYKKT